MNTAIAGIVVSSVNMEDRKNLGIKAGDTVRVHQKIEDKGKTRIQIFEGLVLARKHGDEAGATFTVRKVVDGIGVEKIFEHEREIVGYSLDRMSDFPWIELYGSRGNDRVGVVLFNISGVHPHDVAGILDEEGIAVRSGHHCAQPLMRRLGMDIAVRASFYLYNTKEEVDKFVEVLREVRRLF